MQEFNAVLDTRKYVPGGNQDVIFETFENLNPGEKMHLINDHEPTSLEYQFIMDRPEQFIWQYLEKGPEVWRVSIEKTEV